MINLNNTKKISGTYKIKNIVNNKVYIGSSIDIHSRIKQHKSLLIRHQN